MSPSDRRYTMPYNRWGSTRAMDGYAQGIPPVTKGLNMAGATTTAQQLGLGKTAQSWHPTVVNLLVLILLELGLYSLLRYSFRSFHGG